MNSVDAIIVGAESGIGRRWLAKLRAATNLKAVNALGDEELLSVHAEIVAKLGRWFEREADKNEIGAFFVMVGKEYCALGLPVSELTWALLLDRKAVSEFLVENAELEGAHRIYALMAEVDRVSDFFMLGAYYLTKGFLEETFVRLKKGERLTDESVQKYFKDDFFFKE
ncbi:MAG TPA: hypothetical protein P5165_08865 [Spirochaetia bacterium]|nr:hypothetical protein [Spirochaetia bacterium]